MPKPRIDLNATAGAVGAKLGRLAAEIDALHRQRAAITKDLHAIVAAGRAMLEELGRKGPHGRKRGGRPRGYVTSDATRAKLRAAWQRRRDAETHVKKRSMSEAARSKVAAAARARFVAVHRQG